ncbi:hypothetical protein P872_10200 [Rhodonellum psychrophilum GCM71 = DSM 17998]|uniref:6-phosphogluconolactonase n=1 Tax=Rhodonellum psychrophilum GCM71 = DSM 17998 TaxID=1123057 RepID=U5C001_9BACT|nr:hypothetical protein P872_10200 [Rhodonellum psychrophilum GCM71 = DSM 17998]
MSITFGFAIRYFTSSNASIGNIFVPKVLCSKVFPQIQSMKLNRIAAVLFLLFPFMGKGLFAQGTQEILYIGTFSERGSEGIYVISFDRRSNALEKIQSLTQKDSPSYLEFHNNGSFLYAANRQGIKRSSDEGSVSGYKIDQKSGKLKPIHTKASGGISPCHLSVDPFGEFLYISHYASSHVSMFPIKKNGRLGKQSFSMQLQGSSIHPQRQSSAHTHSVIPDPSGRFVYISDLGTDKILQFEVDRKNKGLKLSTAVSTAVLPGSGPRHFQLHPHAPLAFSVEELNSTLAVYEIDSRSGRLNFLDREAMLVSEEASALENTAADLAISPDGRFVYASNRGLDNIVIYAVDASKKQIQYVGQIKSAGEHPRGIAMDSLGEFLFVTNRDSDNLVIFKRDLDTGLLSPTTMEVQVPAAVVIKQMVLYP